MTANLLKALAATALLGMTTQASAALILTASGSNATETIQDVVLGTQLTVTFEFVDAYTGDDGINFPTFLLRFVDPCCTGGTQESANGPAGPFTRNINTTGFGTRDIRFDINVFGDTTAFATVRISSLLIDGREILSVPTPAPLGLLGLGLLGFGVVSRRRLR